MIICPCKDCKYRKISCHSTCEEYLSWQDYNNELREKVHREAELNRHFSEVLIGKKRDRQQKRRW